MVENIKWLRNLYARFDADVKRLHDIESTWLACRKCPDGFCCSRGTYVFPQNSNPFLIEDWWLMLEYVRDNFGASDKERLARHIISKRTACIFLFNNRCSVYSVRPWGSRIHPYTINVSANNEFFPAGKIELPSCPSLASAFGLKRDEKVIQTPAVIERPADGSLVKVKLKKHRPVWVIDTSDYVKEYQEFARNKEIIPADEVERFLMLAEQAGGDYGVLLRVYLEQVLGMRQNLRLVPS